MSTEPFQTSSFAKTIASKMDQIAHQTVPQRAWTWLIILIIIVIGLFVWSVMGTVKVNIEGKGIILNKGGIFTIETPVRGIVESLFVKAGDRVKEGDVVAKIFDAQKEMLLKTNLIKVDHLKAEFNRLLHEVDEERDASHYALKTQLKALQFDVKVLNEKLEFLDKEYHKKLSLFQENLMILNVVQEAERQISQVKISLEEKKGEISDVQSRLKQSYRTEELKTRELDLIKAEDEVRVIEATLQQNLIRSEFDGKILEVLAHPGEVMVEGMPLYHVELISSDNAMLFYGYFPNHLGKHIHKGCMMRMNPSNINQNEYGSILSRVKEVSEYAISEKAILNHIHNSDLARFLSNEQAVTQVIAEPIHNPKDPNLWTWTSRKGPAIQFLPGTVGTVDVTIERIHPIYYLFPLDGFKKTSLGDSL